MQSPPLSFASFPIEVLSNITSSLNSRSLQRLYITGDSILRVKLEKGGVTEVNSDVFPSPKFFAQFGPTVTTWRLCFTLGYYDGVDRILSELPPTLRSMRLSHTLGRLRDFDVDFPHLEHLEVAMVHSNWTDGITAIPFAFPLTTFKADKMVPAAMKLLPQTLTSLEFECSQFAWSNDNLWTKPIIDAFPTMFPNLKTLCIFENTPPLESVPPSLTSLSLLQKPVFSPTARFKTLNWSKLPRNLTSLRLEGPGLVSAEDIETHFPASLLHVTLQLTTQLETEHVLALPRHLLTFSMARRYMAPLEVFSGETAVLPPTLQYLHFRPARVVQSLPADLKTLIFDPPSRQIGFYPQKLTRVEGVQLASSEFHLLPNTITVLHLTFVRPADSQEEEEEEATSGGKAQLPSSLLQLLIRSFSPPKWAPWLPPGLKELKFIEEEIPRQGGTAACADWFAGLPSKLEVLEIELTRGTSLADDHFAPLQPHTSLKRLSVKGTKTLFTVGCFPHLPRGLETLVLDIASNKATSQDFSELPPTLRTLTLFPIREDSIFYLNAEVLHVVPPKLRFFNVPVGVVSESDWRKAERSLKIVSNRKQR